MTSWMYERANPMKPKVFFSSLKKDARHLKEGRHTTFRGFILRISGYCYSLSISKGEGHYLKSIIRLQLWRNSHLGPEKNVEEAVDSNQVGDDKVFQEEGNHIIRTGEWSWVEARHG